MNQETDAEAASVNRELWFLETQVIHYPDSELG